MRTLDPQRCECVDSNIRDAEKTTTAEKKVLENPLQKHRAKLTLTVHPAARKLAATAMQLRPESSSLISRGAAYNKERQDGCSSLGHSATQRLRQLKMTSHSLITRCSCLHKNSCNVCHLTSVPPASSCEDFKLIRKEREFTYVQVAIHVMPPARDQPRMETDGQNPAGS